MKVRCSRRIISGLLLLWLGLLQFPLPFAVRAGSAADDKDLRVPFPCMNRPCGCRSATACWTSCCCTTKAERIAFVIEQGLEMPAALMSDDEPPETPARSCCAAQKKSCCEDGADGQACTASDKPIATPGKSKLVLLTSALKCKGLSAMFLQFAGAVLPRQSIAPVVSKPAREVFALVDEILTGIPLSPPSPPPRIAR